MSDTLTDLGLETAGFIRERFNIASDMEVRSDGRTIHGIVVPFGQVATVNDGRGPYQESFARGAFAQTISGGAGQRVKLMANHDQKRFPLGRSTMLREDGAGLYGEFHVSATRDGDEVLQLATDKVLDSFSVGFTPDEHHRTADGVVERTRVALREVSVVAFPSYVGALIGGVRADTLAGAHRFMELLRADPDSLNDAEKDELLAILGTHRSSDTVIVAPPAPTTEDAPGAPVVTPEPPEGALAGDTSTNDTPPPVAPVGPSKDQRQRRARALALAPKGQATP